MSRVQYSKSREAHRIRDLDIWEPFRYARARVYSMAVRVHYQVFFARHLGDDPTGSGRMAAYAYSQIDRAIAEAGTTREEVINGTPSPVLAPLCDSSSDIACELPCEVVGGMGDCTCIGLDEFRARLDARLAGIPEVGAPAPFTGTPYDPGSELD